MTLSGDQHMGEFGTGLEVEVTNAELFILITKDTHVSMFTATLAASGHQTTTDV
jgi:hypothetical protein